MQGGHLVYLKKDAKRIQRTVAKLVETQGASNASQINDHTVGSNPTCPTTIKHCTKQWVVQHSSVGRILLVNVVGSSPTVRTTKYWCSWSLQSKLQSSLRYSRQWGTWLSRGKNPNRCRLIWDWSRMNRQGPHKPLEVGLIPIGPTNQTTRRS